MPKGHKVGMISPRQDEIIRKCWEHNAYGHHAAKRAAELTGLTPSVTHRRAMELGLVFTRERYRWTEQELDVIERNAHQSLETIQRKLRLSSPPGVKRTRAAIARQIHAQRFRTNMDGLKHEPLAQALGISGERLHKLRAATLINGQRLESIREGCGNREAINDEHRHWFYHNDGIVRFLFAARGELDLRKVNQTWLMGLLEPYIILFQSTTKDVAIAERERTKLAQRRRRKQLSQAKRPRTQRSTSTRRRAPGILDESMVAAIRAGRKSSARGRRHSSGDPVSPLSTTATGATLRPGGDVIANSKSGSNAVTLPSTTPFSGPAGDPNAV
jgi:hypothetical protein